jgi:hypothetical protein
LLIDCGALSPHRWLDKTNLWHKLHEEFTPESLTRDEAWQLAVLLKTRGFTITHHFLLFGWSPTTMTPRIQALTDFFADTPTVHQAAEDNTASITQADGLAWLKAVLELRPHYRQSVPMWTQLALCALRDEGLKDTEIAEQLGITIRAEFVARWRNANSFDPLTGVPYP